jgi:hypothetical protein
MRVSVTVDTQSLSDSLHRLASVAREAPGIIIKEETKALVKNLIQLTPPKTYAQGRNAVKRDLNKIAIPIGTEFAESSRVNMKEDDGTWRGRLATLIRKRDARGIELMLRNSKERFWNTRTVVQDKGALVASHKQNRNNFGRAYTLRQVSYRRDWRSYLKDVQSRVGWAKSGWVAVADAVGLSTPSWLRKLASKSGAASATFSGKADVFAVNYNVKIPNYQKTVSAAVRNRIRVTETKIKRLIAGKAVNLGFKRVDAR